MTAEVQIPGRVLRALERTLNTPATQITTTCLNAGRWCNANVYRVDAGERSFVVKEFVSRSLLVRLSIGRVMVSREAAVLIRLRGIPGIPTGVRRLCCDALMMDFIPGVTFADLSAEKKRVSRQVFEELEQCIARIHAAGYVHLDLRNLRNSLMDAEGRPHILDFQSYLPTRYLPKRLRCYAEEADYSGVCKGWTRLCRERLDEQRLALAKRVERRRRFWVFKGYWLDKALAQMNVKG